MFSSVTARARVVALVSAAWLTNGSHNSAFAQDHYCGVYSAYAVLDHYGRTVPFDSLLEPAYVSGYQGSTASDVARALVDHGVAAKSFSGLGLFDLRIAGAPIILHVRGHQGTRDYRHWVVFLGEQGGQAVVLDPSRGETRIQYSRLLSLWDGVGVATAESAGALYAWRGISIGRWLVTLVFLGCLLLPTIRMLDRWTPVTLGSPNLLPAMMRTGVFVGICSILAVLADLLDREGILRNNRAKAALVSVHSPSEFPVVDLPSAVELHQRSGGVPTESPTVWIDARFARDFEHGHIPGAYNLPIDATFAAEDAVVERIPVNAEIVVYCQSEGCAFAEAVSERLRGHGLKKIRLFHLGYRAWEESGAPIASEQKKSEGSNL